MPSPGTLAWLAEIPPAAETRSSDASAAAILMLSFVSMSTSSMTDLKILATGLGAGILVDAVVIRCLLVPAMVALFGRANWWLPAPLARLLRIPALATQDAPEHDERPVPVLAAR